jgi:hypothetical protein
MCWRLRKKERRRSANPSYSERKASLSQRKRKTDLLIRSLFSGQGKKTDRLWNKKSLGLLLLIEAQSILSFFFFFFLLIDLIRRRRWHLLISNEWALPKEDVRSITSIFKHSSSLFFSSSVKMRPFLMKGTPFIRIRNSVECGLEVPIWERPTSR